MRGGEQSLSSDRIRADVDHGARPTSSGPTSSRPAWTVVAVACTSAAVVVQVLFAAGLGGMFPGWQRWPFLLLAAPAWFVARPWQSQPPPWVERTMSRLGTIPVWGWLLGTLALAAIVGLVLQDAENLLGHEDAVYANKARSWLAGTPDSGWGIYRPVGLPALGYLALALNDSVTSLRVTSSLLTLATLGVTYFVAARWTSPRRAVLVLLLLISGLGFMRRSVQFLNDIPATALLLLIVFLIVKTGERRRPALLFAAACVAVAAFYLRYGVTGSLLSIVIAAVLAYGPRAWLDYGRSGLGAVGLFLLGLSPHFAYAWHETGSPLGIILSATENANRQFIGDGLAYYLAVFPYRIAGDLGGVVMAAGVVAAFLAARRLRSAAGGDHEDRRTAFLGAVSILLMVVLGLATDGEPRFVYLSVVLLTILGVQKITAVVGPAWRKPVLVAIAVLAALAVPATLHLIVDGRLPAPMSQRESTLSAAQALSCENSPPDGEARLIVTGYVPDLGWYSHCEAITYKQALSGELPHGREISFLLFAHGRLQPTEQHLRDRLAAYPMTTRVIPDSGSLGTARVVTIRTEDG